MKPRGQQPLQEAAIPRPPDSLCFTPWLHMDILTINVMTRICDKWQHYLSIMGNKCDLNVAMQTKLTMFAQGLDSPQQCSWYPILQNMSSLFTF